MRSLRVLTHDPHVHQLEPATLLGQGSTGWCRLDDGAILLQSDPGGTRPFAWRQISDTVHLASYPGQLALLPPRSAPDLQVLAQLARFVFPDGDATSFRSVRRVAAGTRVTLAPGGQPRTERWFYMPAEPPGKGTPPRLLEVLAAECGRIIAGRRAAVLLSGGLDSSAIALAASMAAAATGAPPPVLGSLVYPGLPNDEDRFQAAVAGHLELSRVTVPVPGRPVWPEARELIHRRLTPVVDVQSGAVGELLERLAGEGCEVVFTGFGGDVLFRGTGLALGLAARGRLVAAHRHLGGLAAAMPVSRSRLWYAGVLRPMMTGGWRDRVATAGSGARAELQRVLRSGGASWLMETVQQAGDLPVESPFYSAAFLAEFAKVSEEDFVKHPGHKDLLRSMLREHLPAQVVGRVPKTNFLDYHRTWLERERERLARHYRGLRLQAPAVLGLPADIGDLLQASTGPDSFSRSWLGLGILEFLSAWDFQHRS